MKMTENILAQLTNTDAIVNATYETIATLDPNYGEEITSYYEGLQALVQEVPETEEYIMALRKELASDLRFALWCGFRWNLDCFHNPVNKLLLNTDFEELCQESRMHTLPDAQAALQNAQAFVHSLPENQRELLDPITDHFAYLKTWGYKLAFYEGFRLADNLLPHLVPTYTPDAMLSMRLEQKLYDRLGLVPAAA